MKERIFHLGKMIFSPFYYIYKFLYFLKETDLLGLLVMIGTGAVCIGIFAISIEHDGTILPEVLLVFFLLIVFSLSSTVIYLAVRFLLSVLVLGFYIFYLVYEYCDRQIYGRAEDRGCGKMEGNEDPFPEQNEHKEKEADFSQIHSNCGMLK